jgi:hypothetical protein
MKRPQDPAPSDPFAGKAVKFLLRHWFLWLLLAIMALHATRTVGAYLWSDDFKWVLRTAADADKPWNALVTPLFGSYYRPVSHLVWLMNYYLWGLDFGGYQFMFILTWLFGAALVYAAGCRLGGRIAGAMALAILGLNDTYLMIASWKSWYTSLTEFCAVLGWAILWVRWLETRRRGALIGWIVVGLVAVLCRELAPLIISAGALVSAVLPQFRSGPKSRAWAAAAIWAAASLALLFALPAYRDALRSIGGRLFAGPGQLSGGGHAEFLRTFVWPRFVSHVRSMFQYGLNRYLLTFAVVLGLARAARNAVSHRATLGMVVIGAVVSGGMGFLLPPWGVVALLVLLLIAAALGDRIDRLLGAWFVVSFAPIHFLEYPSGAYHLLALTALILYVARAAARFLQEDGAAAWQRLRHGRREKGDPDAQFALILLFAVCLIAQASMLVTNLWRVGPSIARRVAAGQASRARIESVVATAWRGCPERTAWVDVQDREAQLAGLLLQKRHGFAVNVLEQPDWIGLREFNAPLRLYAGAVAHDTGLFAGLSLLPDSGFEETEDDATTTEIARTGRKSLSTTVVESQMNDLFMATRPFELPAGAYVFGEFLRRDARQAYKIHADLRRQGKDRLVFGTPYIPEDATDWRPVWECAVDPEGGSYVFRTIIVERAQYGRVLADDMFLCRVAELAAKGRSPSGAKTLGQYWSSGGQ